MPQIILFIDGENFLHKVKEVLIERKINLYKVDLSKFDFTALYLFYMQTGKQIISFDKDFARILKKQSS